MYTTQYRWVWTGYGWQYVPDTTYRPYFWNIPGYVVPNRPYAVTPGAYFPTYAYP